jgi:predicted ester cyclase
MSIKQNKELVLRYFAPPPPEVIREAQKAKDPVAAFQKGYRTVAEQFFAPDFVAHLPEGNGDRESVIQYNFALIAAFPDCSFSIDKMVAEGDTVVVIGRMLGTHKGSYQGMLATGKKVDVGYMAMYRIAGGKFVEAWGYMDTLGLMQQLGAIPK